MSKAKILNTYLAFILLHSLYVKNVKHYYKLEQNLSSF